MNFHCPLCGQALSPIQNALQCPSRHSFDLAKEGYCNLLLVQQKASLDPGDNKEMVEARRRFLAAGHFAPIADKLTDFLRSFSTDADSLTVLDAGCGEGYFLGRLKQEFPDAHFAGIDISKWAIKAAAKGHKDISWAVASNKQLPFATGSLDLILCVFGFPFWESFQRALVNGGYILLVDPASDHLMELRELIYEKVNSTDLSRIDAALEQGFSLELEETISFPLKLETNSSIQDLLTMTPHGYRITAEAKERLTKVKNLTTKTSVVFRLLRSGEE